MDGKDFVSRRSRRSLLGSVLLNRRALSEIPAERRDLPKFSNHLPNKSGLFNLIHLGSRLNRRQRRSAHEHVRHRFTSSFLHAETKSLKYRIQAERISRAERHDLVKVAVCNLA